MIELQPEGWNEPKRILVILAHPDDPEFFCGATLARWADAGHEVRYLLFTRGDKGTSDRNISPEALIEMRNQEQSAAAQVIGARGVEFLDMPDGYLVPSLDLRREVARAVRVFQPHIAVTSDPTNYFPNDGYLNHPDHRAAGEITLDGLFPAAGNPMFFPELLSDGLEPHSVEEIWITLTHQPNLSLDVTPFWERKIRALKEHASQIGDPEKMAARQRSRFAYDSTAENPRYEDKFRRLVVK